MSHSYMLFFQKKRRNPSLAHVRATDGLVSTWFWIVDARYRHNQPPPPIFFGFLPWPDPSSSSEAKRIQIRSNTAALIRSRGASNVAHEISQNVTMEFFQRVFNVFVQAQATAGTIKISFEGWWILMAESASGIWPPTLPSSLSGFCQASRDSSYLRKVQWFCIGIVDLFETIDRPNTFLSEKRFPECCPLIQYMVKPSKSNWANWIYKLCPRNVKSLFKWQIEIRYRIYSYYLSQTAEKLGYFSIRYRAFSSNVWFPHIVAVWMSLEKDVASKAFSDTFDQCEMFW